jgi:phosphoesterase RecJ-like protein
MTEKEQDFNSLLKLISDEKKFILATHVQPDGDAMGSLLGFGLLMRKMGKEVFMSWGEPISVPPQYSFLPGIEFLKDPSLCPSNVENFIALDCATLERLGTLSKVAKKVKNLVNIDHHYETAKFATINILDEQSSSTAELVLRISKALNLKLNKDIATCLYVGIVTDTGRFQYSNTTVSTFKAAEELLEYDISPNFIFQNVYENASFQYLKLLGLVLNRAELIEDYGLIYTWILQSDLKETKTKLAQAENLIDSLRAVQGIKIAVVFKELGDHKFNVSLRSKGEINVSKLAEQFEGGGHPNAAGFKGANDIDVTLKNLLTVLRKQQT